MSATRGRSRRHLGSVAQSVAVGVGYQRVGFGGDSAPSASPSARCRPPAGWCRERALHRPEAIAIGVGVVGAVDRDL
jgi:hypothetical protein